MNEQGEIQELLKKYGSGFVSEMCMSPGGMRHKIDPSKVMIRMLAEQDKILLATKVRIQKGDEIEVYGNRVLVTDIAPVPGRRGPTINVVLNVRGRKVDELRKLLTFKVEA